MKKFLSITIILILTLMLTSSVFAAPLAGLNVTTSKATVAPGQQIKVTVNFGQDLGAYTVDIAYDSNLFEYKSATGGTVDDNGTRVRVFFFDNTGGTSPRSSMDVTFMAKSTITTTTPTDFSITANGLANPDATVTFDDITTPIDKSVSIVPAFVPYTITLAPTDNIKVNVEKDMKLKIASTLGENFANTRIIAEATSTSGGTVKLLANDSGGTEFDIIQGGWGSAGGDPIGGVDVNKELDVRGLFTRAGDYSITIKLIDRNNADAVIAEETFDLTVGEVDTPSTDEEEMPEELPQTGNSIVLFTIPLLFALLANAIIIRKIK